MARILIFIFVCIITAMFTSIAVTSAPKDSISGEPLILTPLIEQGKIVEARAKATVSLKDMTGKSYSGYFTVNKTYNSNMFFWYFPAQNNSETAPLILWIQGGPAFTSMFGNFFQVGPYELTEDKTLRKRRYTWNTEHNILFIDNPLGTGYSFTDNDKGHATSSEENAKDLYTSLLQFFALFPELVNNNFYISGISYGGKYAPNLAHYIKRQNNNSTNTKINLKGLAIGNGIFDFEKQLARTDYLYQLGLINLKGKTEMSNRENEVRKYIQESNFAKALETFNKIYSDSSSIFKNLTGFDSPYSVLQASSNYNLAPLTEWIGSAEVRNAIHVGNISFVAESNTVSVHMISDIVKPVTNILEDLLESYEIVVYVGQLDIIITYPLTENILLNLNWSGSDNYKNEDRQLWYVDGELAGYVKKFGNLMEVLIRLAGHVPAMQQPKWTLDLITKFTRNQPPTAP